MFKRKVTYQDCVNASLIEKMHFNGKSLKCENCEDYINKFCEGNKFQNCMDCMIDKARNSVIETNILDLK